MWKKRGRPKSTNDKIDKGTKELQIKKQANITLEAIDLCLNKNIISKKEHAKCMKFRWLYTLKHGAPTLQSKLLQTYLIWTEKQYEENFLKDMYNKYKYVLCELKKNNCDKLILGICVFNNYHKFLLEPHSDMYSKEKFLYGIKVLNDYI
ncbi:MAG: hypothetical protein ACI8ZF_000766 [Candidatus Midichloriaceae bacterium]|jgi:hypothetical protein